jgi:hypothetical protein
MEVSAVQRRIEAILASSIPMWDSTLIRIHFKAILREIQVAEVIAADPIEHLTGRIRTSPKLAPALSGIGHPLLLILEFVEG